MSISEYLRIGDRIQILTQPFATEMRPDVVLSEELAAENDRRRVENSSHHDPSKEETTTPPLDENTKMIHTLVDHMDVGTPTGRLAAMVGEYNNALPTAVAIERNIKPTTLDALVKHTEFFIQEGETVQVVAFQTHAVQGQLTEPPSEAK